MPQIPSSPLASLFAAHSGASALPEMGKDGGNPLNFLLLLTQEMGVDQNLPVLHSLPEAAEQALLPTTEISAESTAPAILQPLLAEIAETVAPVQALPVGGKLLPVEPEAPTAPLAARASAVPEQAPLIARRAPTQIRGEIRDPVPILNPTAGDAKTPVTTIQPPPGAAQLVERLTGDRRPASAPVESLSFAPASSAPANSASLGAPAPSPATAPASLEIRQPVGETGWDRALGQKLAFMAENGVTRAEIRLHPQHLGPLEVQVRVANDEVSVTFQVQHASTREALESALPRLRELFDQQGMNLAQADVSQHSGKGPGEDGAEDAAETEGETFSLDGEESPDGGGGARRVEIAGRGLVDAYV